MRYLLVVATVALSILISAQFLYNLNHTALDSDVAIKGSINEKQFHGINKNNINATNVKLQDIQSDPLLPDSSAPTDLNSDRQVQLPNHEPFSKPDNTAATPHHNWLPGDFLTPTDNQQLKHITAFTDTPDNIQQLRAMIKSAEHPAILNSLINKMIAFDQGRESARFIEDIDKQLMGLVYSGQITNEDHVFSGLEYLDRHLQENEYLAFLLRLTTGGPLEENVASQVLADIEIIQQNLELLRD